jgi:hypothetical protein
VAAAVRRPRVPTRVQLLVGEPRLFTGDPDCYDDVRAASAAMMAAFERQLEQLRGPRPPARLDPAA